VESTLDKLLRLTDDMAPARSSGETSAAAVKKFKELRRRYSDVESEKTAEKRRWAALEL